MDYTADHKPHYPVAHTDHFVSSSTHKYEAQHRQYVALNAHRRVAYADGIATDPATGAQKLIDIDEERR